MANSTLYVVMIWYCTPYSGGNSFTVSSHAHQTRIPKVCLPLWFGVCHKKPHSSQHSTIFGNFETKTSIWRLLSGEGKIRKFSADLSLSRPLGPNLPRGADNPLQGISLFITLPSNFTLLQNYLGTCHPMLEVTVPLLMFQTLLMCKIFPLLKVFFHVSVDNLWYTFFYNLDPDRVVSVLSG